MSPPSPNAPMTILHLTAPGQVGGLESVVLALTAGLHNRGHRAVLGAVYSRAPGSEALTARARSLGVEAREIVLSPRAYVQEFRSITALMDTLRPDVVHTHGYRSDLIGGAAARRANVPWVTTLHGFTGGGLKNRAYEWLQVRAGRRADALVAVSRAIRDRLLRAGANEARVHVVPNAWSERPLLRTAEARRRLGLVGGGPVIGWVGRLSREKGADLFLEALALMRELPWRASIVGDGRERPALQAQAARLGLAERIDWHGVVLDAASIYPAFDVWVLSSRTEGTPIALFEAMAARVPVVAAAVGGVPDVVSRDEAWLVPSEQPDALAGALREVLADPAAAATKADIALATLRGKFAEPAWISAHLRIYDAVTRESRG